MKPDDAFQQGERRDRRSQAHPGSSCRRIAVARAPGRRELFRGGNEVVIVHKGEEYRLRITRNEKLILTK